MPGLNLTDVDARRSEPAFANEVTADAQAANNAGFTGTPSFLIGKTGRHAQKFEPGTLTEPAPFNAAIEKLLKG